VSARILLLVGLFASLARLDHDLQSAVQEARRPELEPSMRLATRLGHPTLVLGGLLAIALFDAAAGPATVKLALLAVVPANAVVEAGKWSVNRQRPDGERRRANSSFPSSHAANAAALAWVLSRRWRRLAPGWWLLAALVAFSRLYLNRHYPGDVAAGAAVGALCAWLAARARPARARRPDAAGG